MSNSRATILPIDTALPVQEMTSICCNAWEQGLLSGFNGNASLRLNSEPECCCITRSGAAKGLLTAKDCCIVALANGQVLYGGPPSTETAMHLAVYRACPNCQAILHTHPRHLLALSLHLADRMEDFLRLPLFEAEVWRAKLGFTTALPPGSEALAQAVASAAAEKNAVWMTGHGLCATGKSLAEALCITEELEHLAHIQLLQLTRSHY